MKAYIASYKGMKPQIHSKAFVAATASIIGDVTIGKGSNIWFGCVIRGDVASIKIGDNTNIQDGSIIHVSRVEGGNTSIGSNVTIGHKVLLHACTLQDACFIGMGSIILDGAVVETGGMLAAGSMLTSGKVIRKGEMWAGSPAKLFRPLTAAETDFIMISANNYCELSERYVCE